MLFDSISFQNFQKGLINLYSHGKFGDEDICVDEDVEISIDGVSNTKTLPGFRCYKFAELYPFDRFLDSLYFVYIVNKLSINVTSLPISMNYMPFFEGEMFEFRGSSNRRPLKQYLLNFQDIYFAHFAFITHFYCFSPIESEDFNRRMNACRCIYKDRYANRLLDKSFLLLSSVYYIHFIKFLVEQLCLTHM